MNKCNYIKLKILGNFSGSPLVKTLLPIQGVWVQSLVRELRSCMPYGMAKKLKK